MDIANEKKWFVYLGDHHEGPFSIEDIQSKMSQGQVTTQNYVWAEGMSDWKAMTEVTAFSALLTSSRKEPLVIHVPTASGVQQDEPSVTLAPTAAASEPVVEIQTQRATAAAVAAATAPAATKADRKAEAAAKAAAKEEAKAAAKAAKIAAAEEKAAAKAAAKAAKAAAKTAGKTAAKSGPGIVKRIVRLMVFAALVGGLVVAYQRGYMDKVMSQPVVRAGVQTVSDLSRPALISLSTKVPLLGQLISPIPSLEDVEPKDYEDLRTAASASLKEAGPKVEVAVSKLDLLTPTFYVATNLPDGAQFEIVVEGISDTLLNQLGFSTKVPVTIERSLGKSIAVKFPDGKPLPRGQYKVFAVDSSVQPPPVQAIVGNLSQAQKPPAPLRPEAKVFANKIYFLGGVRDRVYDDRLKEFHDRLQAKAAKELQELGVFASTFESQLNTTSQTFGKLTRAKPGKLQQKQWTEFHRKWAAFQDQMNHSAQTWTENIAKNEIFYGTLYQHAQQTEGALYKVHELQNQYFTAKVDVKVFSGQLRDAFTQAQTMVGALKSKVAAAQKLPLTSHGMPQREGI